LRRDLVGGYFAEAVAPAVALVRCDGCDVSVGELISEGRHGPAAVEDLVDDVLCVSQVLVAGQLRADASAAFLPVTAGAACT
jgi:hypothetical protein